MLPAGSIGFNNIHPSSGSNRKPAKFGMTGWLATPAAFAYRGWHGAALVSETRYELEFEDTFDGDELDRGRWVPYYLPQWSSRERSAARYEVGGGRLRLLIEADQQPWCPELDGEIRVSSLQTGVFAGPVGSKVGQHRFAPEAVVRLGHHN